VPTLYYDLASPYAYLAVARAAGVLGAEPELRPVLVGAIFAYRGRGSWAQTDERAAGEAEIERRAARYGLPAIAWPEGWPVNSLQAMRSATWATGQGAGAPFARAVYRREFAEGRGLGRDVLAEAAEEAGLDAGALLAATVEDAVKLELRRATETAWELGVQGVPTIEAGGRLYFGDDRLDEAADRSGPAG